MKSFLLISCLIVCATFGILTIAKNKLSLNQINMSPLTMVQLPIKTFMVVDERVKPNTHVRVSISPFNPRNRKSSKRRYV